MKHWTFVVTLALCAVTSAWAFTGGLPNNKVIDTTPAPHVPPPLVEIKGVVSWKTLADVLTVKQKDRMVPKFSDKIIALDKTRVKVQGFMVPLETGENQKRFVLSATTPSCAFCIPGGPDSLIEVRAKRSFKYSTDPIIVAGQLLVTTDDPAGMYYQLVDAEPSAP
jgi:hypothetical protein